MLTCPPYTTGMSLQSRPRCSGINYRSWLVRAAPSSGKPIHFLTSRLETSPQEIQPAHDYVAHSYSAIRCCRRRRRLEPRFFQWALLSRGHRPPARLPHVRQVRNPPFPTHSCIAQNLSLWEKVGEGGRERPKRRKYWNNAAAEMV